MAKNTRLTFRVDMDLKTGVEEIAAREGRSVAQICDAFLRAGVDAYHKQGAKSFQKYITRYRQ